MSVITESPRGNCALGGVNAVLSAVNRVIPIYHAGPGCCMQTAAGEAGQAGGRSPFYVSSVSTPCTNMLERDVIFGGIDRLRETVEGALEIMEADAFFVLTGCTAGIIGDDIKSLTDEFRVKGHPVYPIETPGFLGESYRGYEIAFKAFLTHLVEASGRQPDLVNLFGIMPYHDPFWEGSFEELTRILEKLGLRVNTFFTRHQGVETIRTSSGAALNIIVSPWLLKSAATEYEERFGVPSLRWPGIPVGATDTSAFLRAVGKALGREKQADEVIAQEEDYVYSYLETAIGALSWKRFAVVGDANTVVGVTRYLANDYSFSPIVVIITDPVFRREDKERILKQLTELEYARPPKVYFENDHWNIRKALDESGEITLLIGSTNEREYAMEKNIQCSVISYPITDRLIFNRTYAGYRGSLTLIEDLYDNL
ncbi:MAG: nitrogenase molybdenum-iron protein, alpha and beta chain [Clostridia bacterium]|nr:nitrogenase molybdenum-iron protein, alpha and beta chain [Clostridia bacterium]